MNRSFVVNGRPKPNSSVTVSVNSSTSTASTALPDHMNAIRLYSPIDCYIEIGAGLTAAATSMILPAGAIEYFSCDSGAMTVSALGVSDSGTLYVTPMTN